MTQAMPLLFDFSPFVGQSERYVDLIKQFSAAHAFRSAHVSELLLEDDFHRRPLRPEDFEFLKFQKPVRMHNVSRLPALASGRTLLSIYELGVARLPRSAEAKEWQHFSGFYGDDVQVFGAQIVPFLEAYAFEYLSQEQSLEAEPAAAAARLKRIIDDETAFWGENFARLMRNDYLQEGLRFITVQRWALAPSKRRALARATASGFLDMLLESLRPQLQGELPSDALLEKVAASVGVTRQQHAYCGSSTCRPAPPRSTCCTRWAAARIAPSAWSARPSQPRPNGSRSAPRSNAPARTWCRPAASRANSRAVPTNWWRASSRHCRPSPSSSARRPTPRPCRARPSGSASARWDLGEQLLWLSSIRHYIKFAHRISDRIDVECPGIDRETFVEPFEMCSTTHVHNDHRLVTIEEGQMLFWGNVGMQLKMNVGDKVLIPDGRLHGSTVLSGECTYHQPIIPNDWVQALVAELDADAKAGTSA